MEDQEATTPEITPEVTPETPLQETNGKARKVRAKDTLMIIQVLEDGTFGGAKDGLTDKTLKEVVDQLDPGKYIVRRYRDRPFEIKLVEQRKTKGL